MTDQHPTYLEPSELGTKDYWETYYARTLSHLSSKQPAPIASSSTTKPTTTTTSSSTTSSDEEPSEESEDDIDDDSDPGTSWFSEHNAPAKVLDFLTDETFPLAPCHTTTTHPLPGHAADAEAEADADAQTGVNRGAQPPQQPSILDLGTGNGSMLALLRKRGGFRGAMVGVDYSAQSVELARRLQALRIHRAYLSDSDEEDEDSDEGEDEGEGGEGQGPGDREGTNMDIRFEEWDILSSSPSSSSSAGAGAGAGATSVVPEGLAWFPYERRGFDIVLDKGTFDAVSLSAEVVSGSEGEDAEGAEGTEGTEGLGEGQERKGGKMVQRRVCERYPGIARGLVRPGGFLVVTSCNWTEEELVEWFTAPAAAAAADGQKDRLVVWGRVEYPRFRFGGREGQGVCTVCFQRVVD
ncbi:hypothetical protein BO86DRAFT_457349 [Aspergillus japonicus CBS 114.51]|uniref:Protein-lysine N-methyltransferase EFM4 n=1 Tax=Aspergillus japonicus CBS 114.51 TaxID=1448312 RepID=A0A8T8WWQ9_ASPJA|nr:hypothetical protein BO86DRAFT_457349 [Aspergillus japonicus CBS 114.51]RAH80316.1 hypothetical protein BO86DRAFT_457349 [Aspergillus japonicus CBS 114.51]